jgi:parallel beta-helix repeat protein
MPKTTIALGAALALAGPLHARTIEVAAGPDAAQKLQEALILAEPGDVVQIGAGRIELTDGLSLDANGVTVKGAGRDATVLDFTGQQGAGEGLLVTSDDVTLADFAVLNPHGDGIKSKGANHIVYRRVRVEWTGGPKETNGAYGIYPVESTGVLVEDAVVMGASDAGIYVGQSKDITVRYSYVSGNVAGIEIENSRNAVVSENLVTGNTGGILVFDLPNLPVMGGGNTLIEKNLVVRNNQANFAPKGNIVAQVRRGTGVMIMANDGVEVSNNLLADNLTSQVMVLAYPRTFEDKRYNPYPRNVVIGTNTLSGGATDPQLPGKEQLLAAFGGALPPVLWDGLGKPDGTLAVDPALPGWSLNLRKQGDSPDTAQPGPLAVPASGKVIDRATVGAPAALLARAVP